METLTGIAASVCAVIAGALTIRFFVNFLPRYIRAMIAIVLAYLLNYVTAVGTWLLIGEIITTVYVLPLDEINPDQLDEEMRRELQVRELLGRAAFLAKDRKALREIIAEAGKRSEKMSRTAFRRFQAFSDIKHYKLLASASNREGRDDTKQ